MFAESLSFLPPSEVKLFEHGRHFHSTVVFNKCLFVFGKPSYEVLYTNEPLIFILI
jgi:hypothetical protein